MANHVIEQTRDEITSQIQGIASVNSANVINAELYPKQKGELPAVSVRTGLIETEVLTAEGASSRVQATVTYQLEIIVQQRTTSSDDNVDSAWLQILNEIQAALSADTKLNGKAFYSFFGDIGEPERSGEAEVPHARAELAFIAEIQYRQNAPDVYA